MYQVVDRVTVTSNSKVAEELTYGKFVNFTCVPVKTTWLFFFLPLQSMFPQNDV